MIINLYFQLIVRVLLKDKNAELNYTTGKREIHFHNSFCVTEALFLCSVVLVSTKSNYKKTDSVKEAKIIGNPGCYPTSIALAAFPALKNGLVKTEGIIIDSKSGVTGAGRGLTQGTHYPDTNEAFAAYKAGEHRHTPEIEQTLSDIAGESLTVTFVPHLLPVNRGIESSVYMTLKDGVTKEQVIDCYEKAYKDEKFVRLEPIGSYANIKNVRGSNYCDISLHFDMRNNRLIVSSVIDNMVKGAAGQAIQNMNIWFNLPEDAGLNMAPQEF